MLRALPYFASYALIGAVVAGYQLGGGWTFLTLVVLFAGIGVVDVIVGPTPSREPAGGESFLYPLAPALWAPLQLGLIGWTLWVITREPLTPLEMAGMIVSTGALSGALGITIAHELTHRASRIERLLADTLMVSVTYHHFVVEHVHGHHRTVATPEDPATARYGQSFYGFLPQTLYGGLISAWHLEAARLRRRKRPVIHWRNRVLMGLIAEAALYVVVGLVFGWLGAVSLAAIGFVALFQLEVINYLEHYGLERRRLADGRWERIGPQHSWDSGHRLTGWLLVNLPRHADHHLRPGERYQNVRLVEGAAQLPFGYATMFPIVLFPPLWFRVMNPRVEAWRAAHAA